MPKNKKFQQRIIQNFVSPNYLYRKNDLLIEISLVTFEKIAFRFDSQFGGCKNS